MSRESDNAAIEARNAHRKARDGRRKKWRYCKFDKSARCTACCKCQADREPPMTEDVP